MRGSLGRKGRTKKKKKGTLGRKGRIKKKKKGTLGRKERIKRTYRKEIRKQFSTIEKRKMGLRKKHNT